MRSRFGLLVANMVLAGAAALWAGEAPVAVSPGDASKVTLVEGRCPTFSWGEVAGAKLFELVVYRVGENGETTRQVQRRSFPGSVESWTPSLESCLDRGVRYAWSVRAVGRQRAFGWSAPSLFEVAAGPTEAELEDALEVVRQYLPEASSTVNAAQERSVASRPRSGRLDFVPLTAPVVPTVDSAGNTTARLTVDGEVRTTDSSGAPLIWGRGRPGVIVYPQVGTGSFCSNGLSNRFGLSSVMVDWGSAADGCPVGTWVCRTSDVVACNTTRPDSSLDAWECDATPIDRDENAHIGWLAEMDLADLVRGRIFSETGFETSGGTCATLAVWCCWG
jgi:hypothetical protein